MHPVDGIFVARQVSALRSLGVEVRVLHFLSRGKPLNHVSAWRRLRAEFDRGGFDVIHAQFPHAALIAMVPPRCPLVVTFRGPDLNGVPDRDGRRTMKGNALVYLSGIVARAADQVIAVSRALSRKLKRTGTHVIPSGIDLELFRPIPRDEARRQLGLPADRSLVLFAAQDPTMPNKRLELAEAAVANARSSVDVDLTIATGIHPDRMPLYLNAADALLVTSRFEGSPNVVKEAMACNLPVISVDFGDVRDRFDACDAGAICKDDPVSLGRELVATLRRARRSNGRAGVKHLEASKIAANVLTVYESAMETSR
jgi:glycosyltransferase involved in cell wall biosynthesis